MSWVTNDNHNDGGKLLHKLGYLPVMSEKVIAFKATLTGLSVEAVTVDPVIVLVALTVIVCSPLDTPRYWKPDIPTTPVV